MINKKLAYFRDNFNLRFNQNLLLASVLLIMFYAVLVFTGNNNDYSQIPIKLTKSLLVIGLGYVLVFCVQVPIFKRFTKRYISKLTKVEITIDQLQEKFVKERANTVAMINFYVPEYVISFYNQEYNCHFELICIRELPPYAKDYLGDWQGQAIVIQVDTDLVARRWGKKTPVKVFNFEGMGHNLDQYFFQSASEHASTIPRNLIYYILFLLVTFGFFTLGLFVYSWL